MMINVLFLMVMVSVLQKVAFYSIFCCALSLHDAYLPRF